MLKGLNLVAFDADPFNCSLCNLERATDDKCREPQAEGY